LHDTFATWVRHFLALATGINEKRVDAAIGGFAR
jgi:hypothetical protein